MKLLTSLSQQRGVKHQHFLGDMVLTAQRVFPFTPSRVFCFILCLFFELISIIIWPMSVPIYATQPNYHRPRNRYMPDKLFGRINLGVYYRKDAEKTFGELIWALVPDLYRMQTKLIGKSWPCIRRSGFAVETLQRMRAKLFSRQE